TCCRQSASLQVAEIPAGRVSVFHKRQPASISLQMATSVTATKNRTRALPARIAGKIKPPAETTTSSDLTTTAVESITGGEGDAAIPMQQVQLRRRHRAQSLLVGPPAADLRDLLGL